MFEDLINLIKQFLLIKSDDVRFNLIIIKIDMKSFVSAILASSVLAATNEKTWAGTAATIGSKSVTPSGSLSY